MPDVELFCDVRRGVFNDDTFSGTSGVGAILGLARCSGMREGMYLIKNQAVEGSGRDNKQKVDAFMTDSLYPFVGLELD